MKWLLSLFVFIQSAYIKICNYFIILSVGYSQILGGGTVYMAKLSILKGLGEEN